MLDILIISPHPDDAEMGMGGSIFAFKDKNLKVGILNLTNGEPTPYGSVEKRLKEAENSAKFLNVDYMEILNFPNRFLMDSIEVRIEVAKRIRKLKPTILFIPYHLDAHPDHISASNIGLASRFYAKLTKVDWEGEPHYPKRIIYYFSNHLKFQYPISFTIDISNYIEKKLKLIEIYESQFLHRIEQVKEIIKLKARYYGHLSNVEYAEPFFSYEIISLKEFNSLL
ncbi:MAG: PIG-L family deacetylase [candidate division WOR-3 bacterium]|jgi:bacillithiol biosynthesis deacetylase BshB1